MSDNSDFGQDFAQRLADVFGLYVGRPGEGRRFTREALADATRIPLSSLKGYIRGEHDMPAPVLLRLIAALPPAAGSMLIRQTGYKLAPIEADDDDWDGLGAEASMLTFEIFEAQRDGRIDHRERETLRARTRTLIAKAEGMVQ